MKKLFVFFVFSFFSCNTPENGNIQELKAFAKTIDSGIITPVEFGEKAFNIYRSFNLDSVNVIDEYVQYDLGFGERSNFLNLTKHEYNVAQHIKLVGEATLRLENFQSLIQNINHNDIDEFNGVHSDEIRLKCVGGFHCDLGKYLFYKNDKLSHGHRITHLPSPYLSMFEQSIFQEYALLSDEFLKKIKEIQFSNNDSYEEIQTKSCEYYDIICMSSHSNSDERCLDLVRHEMKILLLNLEIAPKFDSYKKLSNSTIQKLRAIKNKIKIDLSILENINIKLNKNKVIETINDIKSIL